MPSCPKDGGSSRTSISLARTVRSTGSRSSGCWPSAWPLSRSGWRAGRSMRWWCWRPTSDRRAAADLWPNGRRSRPRSRWRKATCAAAEALVAETVGDAWDSVSAGNPITDDQRRSLRLAATHATLASARAVDRCYSAGGGAAIYDDSPLQRVFRDVHVATQHAMVAPRTMELVGRLRLGLPDGHRSALMDFTLPADDDERRSAVRTWLADHPAPTADRAGRRRSRRPALARAVGPRRRPGTRVDRGRRAASSRRRATRQPDRHRLGRPDDPGRRNDRTAATLAAGHPRRLAVLVPIVQRARRRVRPRIAAHQRRPTIGDEYVVNGQKIWSTWANRADWGILIARTDPARGEAPWHQLLRGRHAQPGHRGPADHRDDRRQPLQRDVPHRRPRSGEQSHRRRRRRMAPGASDPRQRTRLAVRRRGAVGHGPRVI